MYKIEITADTLSELAGKAMSLAVKLNSGAATEAPFQHTYTHQTVTLGAPAPEAYAPPVEQPVEINPVAPEAPALSFEQDVAPVVLRAVATKSKAFVEGVMTEFGVARASQLDASRWAELIDRLESPF
jgi:hypothetical protein